jgi:hypothetical protein
MKIETIGHLTIDFLNLYLKNYFNYISDSHYDNHSNLCTNLSFPSFLAFDMKAFHFVYNFYHMLKHRYLVPKCSNFSFYANFY